MKGCKSIAPRIVLSKDAEHRCLEIRLLRDLSPQLLAALELTVQWILSDLFKLEKTDLLLSVVIGHTE